jgi:hypothetical protein
MAPHERPDACILEFPAGRGAISTAILAAISKRVCRLYREMGPQLRNKPPKRRVNRLAFERFIRGVHFPFPKYHKLAPDPQSAKPQL